MSYITISGRVPLYGEVSVQGSKNAVLPILAASLLADKGRTRIIGCPRISDIECMKILLSELGCKISCTDGIIDIDARDAVYKDLMHDTVSGARGSVLMAGALLGRFKKAVIAYPGGCAIGERRINYHIDVMKGLGAEFLNEDDCLNMSAKKLTGFAYMFPEISVGATENAILGAVLAEGITTLYNAAIEPEIISLIDFLNACGARIKKSGYRTLLIEGVKQLTGIEYRLPPDRIVAGTYITAVAASGGKAVIHNIVTEQQKCLMDALTACGCRFKSWENSCEVTAAFHRTPIKLVTNPYPDFPTDMQSQMMAYLTTCKGKSIITEKIFEDRFRIIDELGKMGASITTALDKMQTVEIKGVNMLHGADVSAKDLRGGAALCIAGLMAEGVTNISGVKYIQRGYENICHDLRRLGADICYVDDVLDNTVNTDNMNNDIDIYGLAGMMAGIGAGI